MTKKHAAPTPYGWKGSTTTTLDGEHTIGTLISTLGFVIEIVGKRTETRWSLTGTPGAVPEAYFIPWLDDEKALES